MPGEEAAAQTKRVAVTGATGFIGRNLVRELCARDGYTCRLLVRNPARVHEIFPDTEDRLDVVVADISDPASLRDCFQGCDVVVHLAALVTHSAKIEDALAVNRDGTRNLIKEAKKAGVSRFLHASSTAAIGKLEGNITEEAECRPVMSYQVAKYESEQVCLREFRENGFPAIIMRPSMIYGEGAVQDLYTISKIAKTFHIYPIVGKGENCSPALHVSDMVQAIMLLIEKGRPGEIYNVSSEESYPIRQKVGIIAKTLGIKVWTPHLPAKLIIAAFKAASALLSLAGVKLDMQPQNILNSEKDRFFDITKLKELGFRQTVSLSGGGYGYSTGLYEPWPSVTGTPGTAQRQPKRRQGRKNLPGAGCLASAPADPVRGGTRYAVS